MIEEIDDRIQQAQKQERLAYSAKQKEYENLKRRLENQYSETVQDLKSVDDHFFKIYNAYESTSITMQLCVLPSEEIKDALKVLRQGEDASSEFSSSRHRLKHSVKTDLQGELDLNIETDLRIKVLTGDRFERDKPGGDK